MKISAVASVYYKEKADYLDSALLSVINQTYSPDEIIVVLDGPIGEDLKKILAKYEDFIFTLQMKENVGLGRALDYGIEHAKGDWIFRWDTDDINLNDRFEKQMKYIQENDVDALSGYIAEFGFSNGIRKVALTNNEIYSGLNWRSQFNHPAVAFKKASWDVVGGYSDMFPEDYFLWLKFRKHGLRMANIPEVLVLMRTSNDYYSRRKGMKYIFNEFKMLRRAVSIEMISPLYAVVQMCIKVVFRLMPIGLIGIVYRLFLRKKK